MRHFLLYFLLSSIFFSPLFICSSETAKYFCAKFCNVVVDTMLLYAFILLQTSSENDGWDRGKSVRKWNSCGKIHRKWFYLKINRTIHYTLYRLVYVLLKFWRGKNHHSISYRSPLEDKGWCWNSVFAIRLFETEKWSTQRVSLMCEWAWSIPPFLRGAIASNEWVYITIKNNINFEMFHQHELAKSVEIFRRWQVACGMWYWSGTLTQATSSCRFNAFIKNSWNKWRKNKHLAKPKLNRYRFTMLIQVQTFARWVMDADVTSDSPVEKKAKFRAIRWVPK